MKLSFTKKKPQDERVTTLQNKIYRELYYVIVLICAGSLVYKSIQGGAIIDHIWLEMLILIGGGIYYLARASHLGIFTDEVEMHDRSSKIKLNTKNFITSLLVGAGISLFFAVNNSLKYGETTQETIFYFFLILITSLIIYSPVLFGLFVVPSLIAKHKSDRMNERELEDIDDEDKR
ncbi:hypothetical protein GCM10010954_22080 [Halobacillus andaensis]|uniref:Uncharacterized protein n=1 Tax=Halobacillus andaensis TaxID=1176239 RepID=A0A917B5S2_HALAA|nr:DUF6773 family protein [Halobacillus andaensis]MBP2004284.1 hypothetical protein [Halobacillus andaensis]GGF22862.1 hypothetical protein GCM10010954_22080 [Halobacillus andaensis]